MRHTYRSLWDWARDALARYPRLPRAVKAALAAVLAWLLIQPIGGVGDEYPYYAPLGAVIAVSSTVADSVRASIGGIAAIMIGATLAVLAGPFLPGVLALAVVVLVGTLLAGWWRLGDMGSWVPISGMFVLIIGNLNPGEYVLGYLGLTSVGALVGIGVNAILPPLPLTPGTYQIAAARSAVAAQLNDLAEALRHDEPLTHDEWLGRYHGVRPHADAMARLVAQTADARRVNWRVNRWRRWADQQAAHARALERLSLLVDDLAVLLIDAENDESEEPSQRLKESSAGALGAVAAVLEADDPLDTASRDAAEVAVARYVEAAGERVGTADAGLLTTGAIATALRQVVNSLTAER